MNEQRSGIRENLVDNTAERLTESLARRLNRRKAMGKFFDWGFTVASALVIGRAATRTVQATSSGCFPPQGRWCSGAPFNKACPGSGGCPSGCSVCKTVNGSAQGIGCVYATGFWNSCCGNGKLVKCYDCKCGSAFGDTCGCASNQLNANGACGCDPHTPGGGGGDDPFFEEP